MFNSNSLVLKLGIIGGQYKNEIISLTVMFSNITLAKEKQIS